MDQSKDLYAILGVSKDAEDVVIKAAWRALAQRYHPDKFEGSPEIAKKKMSDINMAYTVLSDQARRAEYDRRDEEKSPVDPPVDASPNNDPPNSNSKNESESACGISFNPYRRLAANWIDVTIYLAIMISLLIFFSTPQTKISDFAAFLWLVVALCVFEAFFIALFGTTPGKWMLGLRITGIDSPYVGVLRTLKRTLYKAPFLLIPLLIVIPAIGYFKRRSTAWDDAAGTIVSYRKNGILKDSVAVILVIFCLSANQAVTKMMDVGKITQTHPAQYKPAPAAQEQAKIGQENTEQQDLLIAAQEIIIKFPELDVNSPTKNQSAIDYVVRARDEYIVKGYKIDVALRMSANDYAGRNQRGFIPLDQRNPAPTMSAEQFLNNAPPPQPINQSSGIKQGPTWYEQRERRQKCNIQPVMTDAEIDACR